MQYNLFVIDRLMWNTRGRAVLSADEGSIHNGARVYYTTQTGCPRLRLIVQETTSFLLDRLVVCHFRRTHICI